MKTLQASFKGLINELGHRSSSSPGPDGSHVPVIMYARNAPHSHIAESVPMPMIDTYETKALVANHWRTTDQSRSPFGRVTYRRPPLVTDACSLVHDCLFGDRHNWQMNSPPLEEGRTVRNNAMALWHLILMPNVTP